MFNFSGSRRYSYDYYSGPYSIIFPAGLTTASYNITIVDDSSLELTNETFSLTIDPLLPEDVTHGRLDTATVIIVSDEGKYFYMFVYVHKIICLFHTCFI